MEFRYLPRRVGDPTGATAPMFPLSAEIPRVREPAECRSHGDKAQEGIYKFLVDYLDVPCDLDLDFDLGKEKDLQRI